MTKQQTIEKIEETIRLLISGAFGGDSDIENIEDIACALGADGLERFMMAVVATFPFKQEGVNISALSYYWFEKLASVQLFSEHIYDVGGIRHKRGKWLCEIDD